MKKNKANKNEKNHIKIEQGVMVLKETPPFSALISFGVHHIGGVSIEYGNRVSLGKDVYGKIEMNGFRATIWLNESISIEPEKWAFVIAHLYLHVALGHFDAESMPGYNKKENTLPPLNKTLWNMACDIYVDKFLRDVKVGQPIGDNPSINFGAGVLSDERSIYKFLKANPNSSQIENYGMASDNLDMLGLARPIVYPKQSKSYFDMTNNEYAEDFAEAVAYSLINAVSIAGGHGEIHDDKETVITKAAAWFLGHYPLLGGIASGFKIDQRIIACRERDIPIAAVDVEEGIIYANPINDYSEKEWRFVLAHEYLHAGLDHGSRLEGRDPYLWNVACDYVVNGWLHDMGIGDMPRDGLLYDPKLKNKSAEEIYDMIMDNKRAYTKEGTFAGRKHGDIMGGRMKSRDGVSLDDFCRSALMQGLEIHNEQGRGFIPEGLIEEIRARAMPPIRWDVKLANWFDKYVETAEKHRSYAYPSRRQGATPDIPRPRYIVSEEDARTGTFGAVIDTSGSMACSDIGKALGSVVSYASSKNVKYVRVVFCDAAPYDAGFIDIDELAGRVEVTGRGGTWMQPAVDLLENATDFPKDAPILIITDGWIEEHMSIHRNHAFLIPKGNRLPFRAKGEVFYYE